MGCLKRTKDKIGPCVLCSVSTSFCGHPALSSVSTNKRHLPTVSCKLTMPTRPVSVSHDFSSCQLPANGLSDWFLGVLSSSAKEPLDELTVQQHPGKVARGKRGAEALLEEADLGGIFQHCLTPSCTPFLSFLSAVRYSTSVSSVLLRWSWSRSPHSHKARNGPTFSVRVLGDHRSWNQRF